MKTYKPIKETNNNNTKMEIKLYNEDCLVKLKELDDNSVDSIVTDPPYEISFMSKGWDGTGIAFNTEVWEECLRVLKPGGHLLAFGATRTYHRMSVAIEDSGFEIRDCIFWCYGSGFPKSHNIALAIDKMEGAIGHRGKAINMKGAGSRKDLQGKESQNQNSEFYHKPYNKPVTDDAKDWNGWGTALKPAVEPVVMARKPFRGSVAQNVLEWGTGGINIDECRIGTDEDLSNIKAFGSMPENKVNGKGFSRPWMNDKQSILDKQNAAIDKMKSMGRFPANLILDEEAGKLLDKQSGTTKSSKSTWKGFSSDNSNDGWKRNSHNKMIEGGYDDEGGASRFFYCPKASKKDRNEGCEELEEKMSAHSVADKCGKCGKFLGASANVCKCEQPERIGISSKNNHPTVKPVTLLQYLIRLVTPKGGVVLDPFMGSGSTGKAAMKEGMNFIGIEKEEEYFQIAEARIEWERDRNKHHQFFDV